MTFRKRTLCNKVRQLPAKLQKVSPTLSNPMIYPPHSGRRSRECISDDRSRSHSIERPLSITWNSNDLELLLVDPIELTIEESFGCHPQDLPEPQFVDPSLKEVLEARRGLFKDGPPAVNWAVKEYIKRSIRSIW